MEDSVSFLSQTRKETNIPKLSRQNDRSDTSEPNQASLRMAKRLEPIAVLLASLPKPLSKQTSEFASSLLSHSIEVRHCERKVNYHNNNPDILPSPIRFKFKLTCKSEYEDTQNFKIQAAQSAKIMSDCKEAQRKIMISVMKMEYEGAIAKLKKNSSKD